MEYVGEVLDYKQFKSRVKQQAKLGQEHHYFMALNSDEVIDASYKGNVSRYMNHSCDPNCETQKVGTSCDRFHFYLSCWYRMLTLETNLNPQLTSIKLIWKH